MEERNVKIVGWIIDDQPTPFIWQSSYAGEVFYSDYYFEGSGEKYYESLITSNLLEGLTPARDGKVNVALAAAQNALMHCGQAFFNERMDYATWDRTFGFAYEVLVYGYGKFWPMGSTMYLPCIYHWDDQSATGNYEWIGRIWKMLFRGEYSVLQRTEYKEGKVFPTHHVIKPVYQTDIDLDEIRKLTFEPDADFYVHHFVLHPSPVEGLRFGMCIVGDESSDKVTISRTDDKMNFKVNKAFLNEKFREAIRLARQSGNV